MTRTQGQALQIAASSQSPCAVVYGDPPPPVVGNEERAAMLGGADVAPTPGAAASQLKSTAGRPAASPWFAAGIR